jgi:tetratricopeptide (TPR) repeat protein
MFAAVTRRRLFQVPAALVLLGASAAGVGLALIDWRAGSELTAADEALQHGRLEEARWHLQETLRYRPRSPAAHVLAARAARLAGNFKEAEEHLHSCRRFQRGVSEDCQLEELMLRAQSGEVDAVFDKLWVYVVRAHPAAPLVLESLCLAFTTEMNMEAARTCIERWLVQQPESAQAVFYRGCWFEQVQAFPRAAEDFRHAQELDPQRGDVRLHLAGVLATQHQDAEAVQEYESVIRREPANGEALLGLARCRRQLGQSEEAERLLDHLLAAEPDNAEALTERGLAALQDDRVPQHAEAFLRRAVAAEPAAREAHYNLHLCLGQLGRQPEAEEEARVLNRLDADMKRLTEIFQNELRTGRSNPDLLQEIGAILLRSGKDKEGLYWLFKALTVHPRHRATHLLLADYYRRTGDAQLEEAHRQMAGPE